MLRVITAVCMIHELYIWFLHVTAIGIYITFCNRLDEMVLHGRLQARGSMDEPAAEAREDKSNVIKKKGE